MEGSELTDTEMPLSEMDCNITNTESDSLELSENDKTNSDTNADTSIETSDVIKDSPPDGSVEEGDNPDRTTESPTTGDNSNSLSGIKCVYCDQILTCNDEPKLLECLHSACGPCVKSKITEQTQTEVENSSTSKALPVITCAACRIVCRQSQIIDNQFIVEMSNDESNSSDTSKNDDQKCKSCDENETATSWCVECAEFICAQCVQAHKRLKITKDHTIKSKEDALQEHQNNCTNASNKNLMCPIHHNEQLTLFCEACDILTCRDCQLKDHRDHQYKFTHEIASETKKNIQVMLKDVSYKRVLLTSAMKVIDDRQNLITEKKQALAKEITQMVVKLTNTINIRGKELVHRLNEVCDNKQKTLNEKKIALDNLSQLTDHCISFVQTALDKGSDMSILYTKRHVTSHLQRIKCRRADIPNPEIPVRIHLALDKVPDLIKVLSSIGAIVVDGKVYPPGSGTNNNVPNIPSTSPVQRPPPTATSPLILPRLPPPYPQQQQQQQTQPHHPPPPPPLPMQQSQQQQRTSPHINSQQQQQRTSPHINSQQMHITAPQQQQPSLILPQQPQSQQATHSIMQQQPSQQRTSPQIATQQQQLHMRHVPSMHQQQQQQQQPSLSQQQQPRPPVPLMRHPQGQMLRIPGSNHQQVSSSTHPQANMSMGGVDNRMNPQLRGLLQSNGQPVYVQTAPGVYQAVQPSYVHAAQAQYNAQQQQQQKYMHPSQQQQQQLSNAGGSYHGPQRMLSPSGHQILQTRPVLQRANIPGLMAHSYQQQQQQQQSHHPQQQQHHHHQQSPQQQQQQPQQHHTQLSHMASAKWHIPQLIEEHTQQHHGGGGANRPPPALIAPDDSFKITLKSRAGDNSTSNSNYMINNNNSSSSSSNKSLPPTVSSTIPKTPSPNLGKCDETERNLDKYCEESVKDLMATIAKLDSNGVQVLAEGRGKTGGSPHVDSSTDEHCNNTNNNTGNSGSASGVVGVSGGGSGSNSNGGNNIPSTGKLLTNTSKTTTTTGIGDTDKDDPNEDWCAVCMDGGELVCCDKCPKVFHQNCHIPPLSVEESDTWQCLLCMNFADIPNNALGERRDSGLSPREKKIAERIVLELYCQYEPSLHFRELVPPEQHSMYYSVIKKPISLEMIKQKLNWNAEEHYTSIELLIKDVRQLFRNAYIFNSEDSGIYKDAKTLEAFFDQQLEKWLPVYAYENFLDDDDDDEDIISPPKQKFRRILTED